MAIEAETPVLRKQNRTLLVAIAPMMSLVLKGQKQFCLAVSPAKQRLLLCVLCAPALRILFWTKNE